MRCDRCCKVFGKVEAGQMHRQAAKISGALGDGSVVHGYSCRDCGGFINEYQIEKSSKMADSDKPSKGGCCLSAKQSSQAVGEKCLGIKILNGAVLVVVVITAQQQSAPTNRV